jgi:hypothetical protein
MMEFILDTRLPFCPTAKTVNRNQYGIRAQILKSILD